MTAKKKEAIIKKPINLLEVEVNASTKYLLNWIMIRRKINAFTNIFRRKKKNV
jgi:hypothetical protein